MLAASLALHLVGALALVVSPMLWHGRAADDASPVMTVTLAGGPPGPISGGMNPLAARPVQTTEPATRPEAVRPPAARTPEMTIPVPKGKPMPKTPAHTDVEEGRGSTPARGAQVSQGAAFGQTGGEGAGTGLSTGGLGGEGLSLDVNNFCCNEYLGIISTSIKRDWDDRQSVSGVTVVKFTIQKDGTVVGVEAERSSGYWPLDRAAQAAVLAARLPPLPAQYANDHLTVHLRFEYKSKQPD
jgi:TonB family protein